MRLLAGTSGFSYKEWKGPFYPEDLPATRMLHYYSRQLPAVEINNTFYRLPKAETLAGWASQVPEDFRFVLKASRRITHFKRLKNCADEVGYLVATASKLGDRLGAILFQLPPNFRKDQEKLTAFVDALPAGARAAFEFRHSSWLDDETYETLADHDCALCLADTEEVEPPRIATASWGYLRLRRAAYDRRRLTSWLEWAANTDWTEVFPATVPPARTRSARARLRSCRSTSAGTSSTRGRSRR